MDCCGDVKVFHTAEDGDISFVAGQPIMENGLETSVYLSLYTTRGWWASPGLGSDLEALESRPLTDQTRLDAEEACRQALQWMIDSGIAKAVTVSSEISGASILGLTIRIDEPDGTTQDFRYRINWLSMQEVR